MPTEVYAVLLGVFVGGFVSYYFSNKLAVKQQRIIAAGNFRAAFMPAIAQMRNEQLSGRETEVDRLLEEAFPAMSVAIETYRPFLSCKDKQAYQEAWNNYSPFRGLAQFGDYYMRENGEDRNAPFERFFQRVEAILIYVPL